MLPAQPSYFDVVDVLSRIKNISCLFHLQNYVYIDSHHNSIEMNPTRLLLEKCDTSNTTYSQDPITYINIGNSQL